MGSESGPPSPPRERAEVGAAAAGVVPGLVDARAGVGVLDRQGRAGLDVARQRRVEGRLVAAHLVVLFVQAAGLDAGGAGRELGAAALGAVADLEGDLGALD